MKKEKTKQNKKFNLKGEELEEFIQFFAFELFQNTTLPQMLNMVQEQAFKYAKDSIEGESMPESEKLNILKRKIEFDQKKAEEEEQLKEQSS